MKIIQGSKYGGIVTSFAILFLILVWKRVSNLSSMEKASIFFHTVLCLHVCSIRIDFGEKQLWFTETLVIHLNKLPNGFCNLTKFIIVWIDIVMNNLFVQELEWEFKLRYNQEVECCCSFFSPSLLNIVLPAYKGLKNSDYFIELIFVNLHISSRDLSEPKTIVICISNIIFYFSVFVFYQPFLILCLCFSFIYLFIFITVLFHDKTNDTNDHLVVPLMKLIPNGLLIPFLFPREWESDVKLS